MAPIRPLLLALAAAFALSACAPVEDTPPPSSAGGDSIPPKPPVSDTPPPNQDAIMKCDASNTDWAKGKLADEALVTRVRTETHSKGVRVIKPGMAVTMDYREDRVNIDVDANNRVVGIRCG